MQERGKLTERIKQRSKELLGYEITEVALKLLPHLHFLMVTTQHWSPVDVTKGETELLKQWEEEDYLTLSPCGHLTVTEEFWNIMNELIYLGYVDVINDKKYDYKGFTNSNYDVSSCSGTNY